MFALKASRYLTHMKRLTDIDRGVRRFYERIAPLVGTPKLGPIAVAAARVVPPRRRAPGLRPRPPAAPAGTASSCATGLVRADEVYAQLRARGVALAIGDHPERPWVAHALTTDWTFVRFHHGHRGRRGNYSESELREWAQRLADWRRSVEVYAYFNNDWEGFAVRNGLRLRELLGV